VFEGDSVNGTDIIRFYEEDLQEVRFEIPVDIYDKLEKYAIAENESLSAWINSVLRFKVGNIFKIHSEYFEQYKDVDELIGEDLTSSNLIDEIESFEDIYTEQHFEDVLDFVREKDKFNKSSLRKALGIGEEWKSEILETVKRILISKLPTRKEGVVNNFTFGDDFYDLAGKVKRLSDTIDKAKEKPLPNALDQQGKIDRLENRLRKLTSSFRKNLQKGLTDAFRSEIRVKLFGSEDLGFQLQSNFAKYTKFLKENYATVYDKIPYSALLKRYGKATGEEYGLFLEDLGYRYNANESRQQGKIDEKAGDFAFRKLDNKELYETVNGKDVIKQGIIDYYTKGSLSDGSNRPSNPVDRAMGLADMIAIELGFDATIEVLRESNVMDLIKLNEDYNNLDLSSFAKALDRNPDIKFSINPKPTTLVTKSSLNLPSSKEKQPNGFKRKPKGLWYATGEGWKDYVGEFGWKLDRNEFNLDLDLDKILVIDTKQKLIDFDEKYGGLGNTIAFGKHAQKIGANIYPDPGINWNKVQEDYSGIQIAGKDSRQIYTDKSDGNVNRWYGTWAVGSGAIWNNNAIKGYEKVTSVYVNLKDLPISKDLLKDIKHINFQFETIQQANLFVSKASELFNKIEQASISDNGGMFLDIRNIVEDVFGYQHHVVEDGELVPIGTTPVMSIYANGLTTKSIIQLIEAVTISNIKNNASKKTNEASISLIDFNGKFSANDTKRDLKWKSKEEFNGKEFVSHFKINDKKYKIVMDMDEVAKDRFNAEYGYKDGKIYDLSFGLVNDKHVDHGITNTGDASPILSIVYNGVLDFINNNEVDALTFTAKEPSKVNVWNKFADAFVKEYGFIKEVTPHGYDDGMAYFLSKPKVENYELIDEVFEENTELDDIGTMAQYAEYIKNVFPLSKIKSILFHGSPRAQDLKKSQKFKNKFWDEELNGYRYGSYFSEEFDEALSYAHSINNVESEENIGVLKVLIDVNNIEDVGLGVALVNKESLEHYESKNLDAVYTLESTTSRPGKDGTMKEIVLLDSSKTHILGSKKDIDGFQNFVDNEVAGAQGKFSTTNLDTAFNMIIEESTGIPSEKEFDKLAKGLAKGSKRWWKIKLFMPYGAEDFLGLMYPLLGKGVLGDAQLDFFADVLFKPFNRAMVEIFKDRVRLSKEFKNIKNQLKNIPKNLRKEALPGVSFEDAIRVYAWAKQGIEVDGVNERTIRKIEELINENPELIAFIDNLIDINGVDGYYYPGEDWLAGSITRDMYDGINKTKRKRYLKEWQDNVDVLFSKKNMLKLEAAYGSAYISALRDSLRRMQTGQNKPSKQGKAVQAVSDWAAGATGVTMFLNARSAVLQLISTANFVNWTDNNPLLAAKAAANVPQYAKDIMTLLNSEYMVDRRSGLKINVSESDLADAARKGGVSGMVSLLLKKGFVFTKVGDSTAIALGGATFYRNRINTYIKQGLNENQATDKAFEDFMEKSETSQQSARPDKISQQQASVLGRFILAFANTPMQYNRIIKRSFQYLKNGRGNPMEHISKIIYYGFMQNLIFNTLQQGLYAMAFMEEDEEQEKMVGVANGMVDSILRGSGYWGAGVAAIKNFALKWKKESEKEGMQHRGDAAFELLGFMPPIQAKLRDIRNSGKTIDFNNDLADAMGWGINEDVLSNPNYQATALGIEGFTNIPVAKLMLKLENAKATIDNDYATLQNVGLWLGWNKWNIGIDPDEDKEKLNKKYNVKRVKARKAIENKRNNKK